MNNNNTCTRTKSGSGGITAFSNKISRGGALVPMCCSSPVWIEQLVSKQLLTQRKTILQVESKVHTHNKDPVRNMHIKLFIKPVVPLIVIKITISTNTNILGNLHLLTYISSECGIIKMIKFTLEVGRASNFRHLEAFFGRAETEEVNRNIE